MQRERVPPQKRKKVHSPGFPRLPLASNNPPGNQDKLGNQTYKYSDLQKGKEVSIQQCTHHFSSISAE